MDSGTSCRAGTDAGREQRAKPLFEPAKSDVMGAVTDLPLADMDAVKIGQKATVLIAAKSFPAKVSSIAMQAKFHDEALRYRIEVEFNVLADNVFRAGQAAIIRLP